MLRVMFDLALRVSEVRQLDVADLELDRGALWVSGKGRADKELLSLPETTQEAIRTWLRVRGTQPGPLFLTLGPRRNRRPTRRRFTARGIYRIVSELGEQAGVKVWPHGLRHTAHKRARLQGVQRLRRRSKQGPSVQERPQGQAVADPARELSLVWHAVSA